MPLTHLGDEVSLLLENFGEQDVFVGHILGVGGRDDFPGSCFSAIGIPDGINPVEHRILARHDTGPTGRTIGRRCVAVGKDHSLRCQPVNVGGVIATIPHKSDIHDPEVIGDNVNDIGRALPATALQQENQTEKRGDPFHGNLLIKTPSLCN
jgi:hypothetical protein